MLLAGVRAVFFDAVGTLIHPDPSAAAVYATVGRRWGSRLSVVEIGTRLRRAFAFEEEEDRRQDMETSEEREIRRWRRIVETVLDDVADPGECFRELFAHFARPDAWRCEAEAGPVLHELSRRGYRLGLASNYDHRLRSVVGGLPELEPARLLVISSEVGWRKPSPEFFAALCRFTGESPAAIALVGDDPINDCAGAGAAGLLPVLFDPLGRQHAAQTLRIARLQELLRCIPTR